MTKDLKYAYLGAKNVGIKELIFKNFWRQKTWKKKILKIPNIMWVTKGIKYTYLGVKKRWN